MTKEIIQAWLVRVGFIVLLLALVHQVTRLFWALQLKPTTVEIPELVRMTPLASVQLTKPAMPHPSKPQTIQQASAKPVSLNLQLQGIYYEKEDSLALVKVNGHSRTLAPADEIISGVTVKNITPAALEINNNGKLERFTLPEQMVPEITNALNASNAISNAPASLNAQTSPSATQQTMKQAEKGTTQKGLPNDLKRLLYQNPAQLLRYVNITPKTILNDHDETVLAYQVTSLEQNVLTSIGLAENDVLIELNQRQASPESLTQVLSDVKKGKKINAKISRDGKIIVTTLDL